jgi:NADPH-dependent glutamate synthase beta subunit-like oxidoreductase
MEGGNRRWSVTTTEFLPQEGWAHRLGGLRCQEVDWVMDGQRPVKPVPKAESEFILKTDLAFLALGFVAPELGLLATTQSFVPDKQGRLGPGFYAAGDAVTGPSLVVRAINSGLMVAGTILSDYLNHSQVAA